MSELDFVAIDFETANPDPYSACQLGLAEVRGGEIADKRSWLIRPPDRWFRFTYIHGITWQTVADEPTFRQLWPEIWPYLEGKTIAAHNVRFDLGVLSGLVKYYGLAKFSLNAVDSVTVARQAWPSLPNHKLHTIAAHLGIPLNHHEAASDAQACARILCTAEEVRRGALASAVRRYGCGL